MNFLTIAIVTCWYGPFPWYFPYFVHSCRYNLTVDFIIITDNETVISNKPANIKIVYKTLEEVKEIAATKLGFEVNIDEPYKLCDFKPAYGFLFADILQEYDFWGHGDIDVVYGNIRDFMTDKLLSCHDIISSRHDYITGSFCLFRNNEMMNTLFMQSRDYRQVFSTSAHYCFDECNFLFEPLNNGASILDFPDNIQSITYLVRKAEQENKLRAFFDFIIIEGTPGFIKWDSGKIIYKNEYECMFYHLIKFKIDCTEKMVLDPMPEIIYFTETQIFSKEQIEISLLQTT